MKKEDWKRTESNNGFGSMTFLASSFKLISFHEEGNMICLWRSLSGRSAFHPWSNDEEGKENHRQIKRLNSYFVSYTTASLMSKSRVSLRFMSFLFSSSFNLHWIQSIHRKRKPNWSCYVYVDQMMYFVWDSLPAEGSLFFDALILITFLFVAKRRSGRQE